MAGYFASESPASDEPLVKALDGTSYSAEHLESMATVPSFAKDASNTFEGISFDSTGNSGTGAKAENLLRPQAVSSSSWSVRLVPGQSAGTAEAPPWVRPTGTGADAFNVLSVLGRGSFGTVYKVSEKATGLTYAMKVLQKEQVLGQDMLRCAMAEKSVHSLVSHPFIVGLACTFQTQRELVFVMQHCAGGSLDKLVKSEGRLPEDVSRLYFSEVFLAIEYLHGCKVLYRDLKCENVMLDEWGHAMLTDFGLSREHAAGAQFTEKFFGPIAYTTPEVLASQPHGRPVDIYGLGVLLYEMLTGLPPYYDLDQRRMFDNIQRAQLKLPRHASEPCGRILCELLQRNPVLRLGALRTSEIRQHDFLADVDFEAVLRRAAGVTPPGRNSRLAEKNTRANAKAMEPFQNKRAPRHWHVDGWEYPTPECEPRRANCWRSCLFGPGA